MDRLSGFSSPSYTNTAHRQFLRMGKLKGKGKIEVAARHNLREIQAEFGVNSHIDRLKTPLNRILRGAQTAKEVAFYANSLLEGAAITRPRKDAVRAIEIVFSLPPNISIDVNKFFIDSTNWADGYFDAPILSAVIHMDEEAPHCHLLVLPLVNGRMIGSDLMGNRNKLMAMQSDFYIKVAQSYGLRPPLKTRQYSKAIKQEAAQKIVNALKENPLHLRDARVAESLIELLSIQMPLHTLELLGLSVPQSPKVKGRSFTEIMTKPERKEKSIGFDKSKPIGIGLNTHPIKSQTLCSVGFTNQSPLTNCANASNETQLTRWRDEQFAANFWNVDTGEFIVAQPIKST